MFEIVFKFLNKSRDCTLQVYEGLKVKQIIYLRSIFKENDKSFCLATGYGKFLVYDILPFVKGFSHCSVVIVVTPLNVIVNKVVSRHGDLARKVCSECTLSGTKENIRFQTCCFRYLVDHPEIILEKQVIDIMKLWGSKVDWIVIDEAHCVSKWGTEYRHAFQRLGSLRAIFPTARVIAMTVIAAKKDEERYYMCVGRQFYFIAQANNCFLCLNFLLMLVLY